MFLISAMFECDNNLGALTATTQTCQRHAGRSISIVDHFLSLSVCFTSANWQSLSKIVKEIQDRPRREAGSGFGWLLHASLLVLSGRTR
jgi:hypothetical protein